MDIDEHKATELWNLGYLDKEICEKLGYDRKQFANWRRKRGMSSNAGLFDWENRDRLTANYTKAKRPDLK